MIKKRLHQVFRITAIIALLLMTYILKDAHRSRAALIPTKKITNVQLFEELDLTNGLHYSFEGETIINQYKNLIPDHLLQSREEQLSEFLKWFTENYYPPSVAVENYAALSPEYPDLLLEQYKKRETVGSCYNDAILFSFLTQVNRFKVRQVQFINKDGYGNKGHTMVELWFNSLQKWVVVDAQNSALFYKNNTLCSALELRNEVLGLDSTSFYNAVSIQQFNGFSIPKQKLHSFFKKNCTDFVVSSFSNPQTKVANSYFYGISHSISKKNNKFLEKVSRFLRSLLDKSRVNYLYVDKYTTDQHYSLWYYCFNVSAFILLMSFFYWINTLVKRKKSV